MNRSLMLSVHPKYASKILLGDKTVELRRMKPSLSEGDRLFFYVTTPDKALKAFTKVEKVHACQPEDLWEQVKEKASITYEDFTSYFYGKKTGYAIFFKEIVSLDNPISLSTLKAKIPGFVAPQGYRYLSDIEVSLLLKSGLTRGVGPS